MILVVEDDIPNSRAVTLALKTAGHEVMNASDGSEALELLAIHHFDLVITDLVLPNLKRAQSNQYYSSQMAPYAANSHVRLPRREGRKSHYRRKIGFSSEALQSNRFNHDC
jgi:CheY-like chemotaxis protein